MTIEIGKLVRGKIYHHKTKGLSRLISNDPDDGACLIMEEYDREDGEICHYFACERQELIEVPENARLNAYDLGHVDCPGCMICLENMRMKFQ